MIRLKALALATATTLASASVLADEVWTSNIGDVVYAAEVGEVAVFSYALSEGGTGHLYFPGLAGNYANRGTHVGYWIGPGQGPCAATLKGADGRESSNWGQLMLVFHGTAFPTGWTMLSGACFGPFSNTVVAEPKMAPTPTDPSTQSPGGPPETP